MLAGVNRERLLGHVVALFEHLAVYHREVPLDEFGVLIGDIQPELVAAGKRLLLHHALGNHVTGSKLLALRFVLLHEALLVTVQQICALAADRLGNQEALAVLAVCERRRVELHITEVLYLSAQVVRQLDSVAGGDSGIRREIINSADTAGRQDYCVSAVILVLLPARLVVVRQYVREEHSVLLLQSAEYRPVDNGNILEFLHLLDEVGFDLESGGVLVVRDTAA